MKEVYYKFILYLGIAFMIALVLFVPMLIERLYDYFCIVIILAIFQIVYGVI